MGEKKIVIMHRYIEDKVLLKDMKYFFDKLLCDTKADCFLNSIIIAAPASVFSFNSIICLT